MTQVLDTWCLRMTYKPVQKFDEGCRLKILCRRIRFFLPRVKEGRRAWGREERRRCSKSSSFGKMIPPRTTDPGPPSQRESQGPTYSISLALR